MQRIEAAVNSDNLWSHLEWFSQVRRDTGGPGEDAACDYIVSTLKSYGVPVRVHEFDAFLSYPRQASLQIVGHETIDIPCVTHSFCASTGPGGLIGEVRLGSDQTLSNQVGEIVLIDGLLSPFTVLQASQAGVGAIIFANPDRVIHNMIGTTIWGTPTLDQLHRLPSIPVVSINRENGAMIKELMAKGPVSVKLVTEVETGWFRSKLPEAIITGHSEPDKFVLVGAHYCSWEVGVTDNATGDAVLLEMARVLNEQQAELKRSVRLCWWPGHSHGRYSGSAWYADTFFEDLADNCIAYHNIDSPGVRGATHYVARHTTAEIQAFCRDVIAQHTGQQDAPIHRPSRAADQSFLANGVPAFSCYPFLPEGHEDRRPWTGGCANALWWHSSEDTLDKADRDIITLDTKISATAVATLCTVEILPLNPIDMAAEVSSFVAEFCKHAAGHIDTTLLRQRTEQFSAAAQRLMEAVRLTTDEQTREAANRALMRLSRILGPVIYSKSGRFQHDPADWTPIMRNVRTSIFPGLNPVEALSELQGKREYGFLLTQLERELNRVRVSLAEATEFCNHTAKLLAS